ncbi:MAG: type II toxin-antitoxin system HicB family antitoxin [bacterium]|nr:type II toxin-antitoxin system HicB family antitoxin [bacterium]
MRTRQLHTIVWKEDDLFVAKFLELELASQGDTKAEAIKNLKEALDLYLEDQDSTPLEFPDIDDVSARTISFS